MGKIANTDSIDSQFITVRTAGTFNVRICRAVRYSLSLFNVLTSTYGKRQGTLKSDSEWCGEWLGDWRMANCEWLTARRTLNGEVWIVEINKKRRGEWRTAQRMPRRMANGAANGERRGEHWIANLDSPGRSSFAVVFQCPLTLSIYQRQHCAAPVMWEIVRPWATMLGSSVLLWFEAWNHVTIFLEISVFWDFTRQNGE